MAYVDDEWSSMENRVLLLKDRRPGLGGERSAKLEERMCCGGGETGDAVTEE